MANPDQLFVMNAISRKGISENLNDYLENVGITERLEPDDERLTDEVCTAYAAAFGDLDEEAPDVMDQVAEIEYNLLTSLGFVIAFA